MANVCLVCDSGVELVLNSKCGKFDIFECALPGKAGFVEVSSVCIP